MWIRYKYTRNFTLALIPMLALGCTDSLVGSEFSANCDYPDAGHSRDAQESPPDDLGPARTYPGAVGWDVENPDRRGWEVRFVTNTEARGPGSLRDALVNPTDAPGLIVIPTVSGLIDLDDGREPDEIEVRGTNLLLAGHMAPAPGLVVRGTVELWGGRNEDVNYLITGMTFTGGSCPDGCDPLTVLAERDSSVVAHFVEVTFAFGHDENFDVTPYAGAEVRHLSASLYRCASVSALWGVSCQSGCRQDHEGYGGLISGGVNRLAVRDSFFGNQGSRNFRSRAERNYVDGLLLFNTPHQKLRFDSENGARAAVYNVAAQHGGNNFHPDQVNSRSGRRYEFGVAPGATYADWIYLRESSRADSVDSFPTFVTRGPYERVDNPQQLPPADLLPDHASMPTRRSFDEIRDAVLASAGAFPEARLEEVQAIFDEAADGYSERRGQRYYPQLSSVPTETSEYAGPTDTTVRDDNGYTPVEAYVFSFL